MGNFLKTFGYGFLLFIGLPFILVGLIFYGLFLLIYFFVLLFKSIIFFFKGMKIDNLYSDLDEEAERILNNHINQAKTANPQLQGAQNITYNTINQIHLNPQNQKPVYKKVSIDDDFINSSDLNKTSQVNEQKGADLHEPR